MAKLQDKDFEQVSGGVSAEDQEYYEDRLKGINETQKKLYAKLLNPDLNLTLEERKRIQISIDKLDSMYNTTKEEWDSLKSF